MWVTEGLAVPSHTVAVIWGWSLVLLSKPVAGRKWFITAICCVLLESVARVAHPSGMSYRGEGGGREGACAMALSRKLSWRSSFSSVYQICHYVEVKCWDMWCTGIVFLTVPITTHSTSEAGARANVPDKFVDKLAVFFPFTMFVGFDVRMRILTTGVIFNLAG